MGTIHILSPVDRASIEAIPLAPPVPTLEGLRLGIRHDRAWRSFDIFADELRSLAPSDWSTGHVELFDPGDRIGRPEAEAAKIAAFADRVDVAIVGLGT